MDLVSAATSLSHACTIGQVQMAVAKKLLQMQEMQGHAALHLLEAASDGAAKAGDAMVAAATGLGGEIDVLA